MAGSEHPNSALGFLRIPVPPHEDSLGEVLESGSWGVYVWTASRVANNLAVFLNQFHNVPSLLEFFPMSGLPRGWTKDSPNSVCRADFDRLFPEAFSLVFR